MIERPLNITRRGVEVAKRAALGTANENEHSGVKFWASGCWSTIPVQHDIPNIHETTAAQAFIIRQSAFNWAQIRNTSGANQDLFTEINNYARAALVDAGYSGAVPTTGDPFLVKSIPAGASTNPATLSANSGFDSALPALTYEFNDVPMDRVAVSKTNMAADQGVFLRWAAPGTPNSYPRYLFSIFLGQYAVIIRGDGRAELHEYCHSSTGTLRWIRRKLWRYAPEGTTPGTAHSMAVFPHSSPNGARYIGFSNLSAANAPNMNTSERADIQTASVGEDFYRIDATVRAGDADESPGHVTKSDKLRLDVRRDLRLQLQISKLTSGATGILIDDDGHGGSGYFTGNTSPVVLTMAKVTPTGTGITGVVQDGISGVAFVPGTDLFPQGKFTFTSDGTAFPLLWGYRMAQPGVSATSNPGTFSMEPRRVSVTGYAGDPQEEAASVNVIDLPSQHTRLQKRGEFSARIRVNYAVPGDTTRPVTLLRGYLLRTRNQKWGTPRKQGIQGTVNTYAAADWREYDLAMVGMWHRLAERVEPPVMRQFVQDPDGPPDVVTGGLPPYKVTDVIRELILSAGFPSGQVNIIDLQYRLWQSASLRSDDYAIQPAANFAEMCVRLCREYLGCYLHFEPNAGTDGQWMLLFGTQPAEDGSFANSVWNFVSDQPAFLAAPHVPQSFPAKTSPIIGKMSFVVIPPDFNMVEVSTDQATTTADTRLRSIAFAYNFKSFHVPNATVAPSPEHPDYLGRCRPFLLIAPQLAVPGDYEATAYALKWTTRRYYDFLCHAQRICNFQAPLPFIQDGTLAGSASGGWRPIRFQDPITIDGDASWLVKSIRIDYENSRFMTCEIEAIQPFPGQTFIGSDGREFMRRAVRRQSQRASGHNTHSALHGSFSPTPHKEQVHLELPVVRQHFAPLQNDDGTWAGDWADYDSATRGV